MHDLLPARFRFRIFVIAFLDSGLGGTETPLSSRDRGFVKLDGRSRCYLFNYKLESSTAPVDEQAQAAAAARQPWWLLRARKFQFRQNVFADLLDSLILDVASEAHRAARLGFDYRLRNEEEEEARTCASARNTLGDVDSAASENTGKYTVDVFEQTHPSIAQEMFDCMNCGRPIVAGRFAPHLEKCMGKGRKARLKPNSGASATQPRRGRAAVPASRTTNNDIAVSHNRPSSRPAVRSGPQESQRSALEVNGTSATPAGSPEADKEGVPGPSHLGKARTKKTSLKVLRVNPVEPIPFGGVVGRGGSALDTTTLGSLSGMVSGMAVPVAVETEANHKPTGGSARTGTIKGRKVGEKKRKIGQVMAGSASVSNGGSENGEFEARPRPVDVRVENSDASAHFSSPSWG